MSEPEMIKLDQNIILSSPSNQLKLASNASSAVAFNQIHGAAARSFQQPPFMRLYRNHVYSTASIFTVEKKS